MRCATNAAARATARTIGTVTAIAALGCSRGRSDPAPPPTAVAEAPPSVPATWRRFAEWGPDCPLWLPPSAEQLPPPIRWEPCAGAPPGLSAQACRQLVIDWDHRGNAGIAHAPSLSVDSGAARLFLTRVAVADGGGPSSYLEWIVGDVDGPLDFAMRQAVDGTWRCVATEQQLHEGRFAIRLRGDGHGPGLRSDQDTLLLGHVGSLRPAVVLRDATRSTASWSVGARWLVRGSAPSRELFLHAHDLGGLLLHAASGDPDGLTPIGGMPLVVGDDVIYEVAGSRGHALMAHDARRGPHPLVRGDASRADGNAGTDGKHLVWTRAEGGRPGGVHPRRSILVADYTTDPAALRPRRLRSDPNPVLGAGPMRFAVGCGFAGRNAMPPRDLLIVRLADGVSWQLTGTADWSWGQLLGFTCEEAFATVFSRSQGVSVARVRLDSLGPGLAPD